MQVASAPLSSNMAERQTIITESLTSIVLNSLQHGARQTVRGIALRNSIAVASAHKILTEHMYMICTRYLLNMTNTHSYI